MNHTYINNTATRVQSDELKAYEATRRLKADERRSLREWVADGNSVYDNPYHFSDDRGRPFDYIEAIRTAEDMRQNPENYGLDL